MESFGKLLIVFALVLTVAVFGAFAVLMGVKGILIFCAALAPVFLLSFIIKSKIGGMTGDTIGAVSEIAELTALFLTIALIS